MAAIIVKNVYSDGTLIKVERHDNGNVTGAFTVGARFVAFDRPVGAEKLHLYGALYGDHRERDMRRIRDMVKKATAA